MILLLLQNLLLVAFGIGLYLLWRAAEPSERWLKWIVATGFLARAAAGQALFWISWTRLPILRSLQTADGYWLFAQDSGFYFPEAIAASERGWRAIVFYDRGSASVSYVQLLAGMVSLLGRPSSVGILLNLFCYLGTIALLVRWSRAQPRSRTAVAVAIVAISLSPSLVLWSLQPLKDSLFQLLFVAFVAACATWQRVWLAEGHWRARAITGLQLAVILFLLAGIRWYFAGALVAATSAFLLIVAFAATERKAISFAAAVMMIVVLTQSLVLSAQPYMPPSLVALLTMKSTSAGVGQVPHSMLAAIEEARRGFDTTPANTMIKSGERLAIAGATPRPAAATLARLVSPPPAVPTQPPRVPAPPPPFTEEDATKIRTLLDELAAAWNRFDVARAMDCYWRSPQLELVDGTSVVHGWEQAAEQRRLGRSAVSSLRISGLRLAGTGDTASLSGRWEFTTLDGYPQARMFMMTMRRFPDDQWKIVREEFPSTTPVSMASATPVSMASAAPLAVTSAVPVAVTSATPVAVTSATPVAVTSAALVAVTSAAPVAVTNTTPVAIASAVPLAVVSIAPSRVPSRLERLIVGAAALIVPRVLGERLGLFFIGGGRGPLWFTEIDTLIFDLVLFFALWAVFGARWASACRNPLMWLALLTTLIVVAPLVYSISNFGTLFRLREMIYLGLLLTAIAATTENRGRIAPT